MKYCILLILIAFKTSLFSQDLGQGVANQTNLNQLAATGNDPTQVVRQYDDRYTGVKGSPYLVENFIPGQVTMKDGKIYKSGFLNYNAYEDELLFKKGLSDRPMIVSKKIINTFALDSTQSTDFFRFQNFSFNVQAASGYFAVLYAGKIKLLCKITKIFTKADFKGAYSAGQAYDKFDDQKQYYFLPAENVPIAFKNNTQSISNAFPSHSEEIKTFIKKNRLSPKKTSDLLKIFQFIDGF